MNRAMRTTPGTVPSGLVISLTTSPASSGVATPITAENTVMTRNRLISIRYGVANDATRRSVPGASLWSSLPSWCAAERICHIA